MNYEDESYVRFYTRHTPEYKILCWQAKAVMALMLKGEFDRAGVFEHGRHDVIKAVSAATTLPREVVEVGLPELLEDCWRSGDGLIIWPNFIHAQSCSKSEKGRQRESRENRAAEALSRSVTNGDIVVTGRDVTDTNGDILSRKNGPVTDGHSLSRDVTLSLAQPILAQPNLDPPKTPKGSRRKKSSPIPDDCEPNDKHRALAAKHGKVVAAEAELMKADAEANDRRQVSWDGFFTKWLLPKSWEKNRTIGARPAQSEAQRASALKSQEAMKQRMGQK